MNKPLERKVAIVSGSARNIGRAIALGLAEDGACVVVNAKSSQQDAEGVAAEIRSRGGRATLAMADLSDPEQVKALFAQTQEIYGRLDVLVNNAAVRRETALADISLQEWRDVLSSILDASFLCAQTAASCMEDGGRIINIGGLTAHSGAPGRAHVVAAKAGLVGLTKALAIELAPRGITSNIVVPGRIATNRKASGLTEPIHHSYHSSPLNIQGASEDVAAMTRHLAGPGGRYVTGQTIHVNGGIYLP
ncbi:SDR family oxidoreductase [Pseudaminobacter arsenicus]|uniref:SDR family oxidoreductase n=1 Tax=Borborobacter arsenicus TaxID=1851146 RepID=A0A432V2T5_9HYPH|nr:SDR family oxidoreductase [Pseudaminobacter arsenicus]RUM96491.1 SDR family oxidoreductase [Pseudaminobacter arsenicus]